MVAFDRGEESLTLGKAFAILRVVGLMDQPTSEGAQDVFVQEAIERWRELSAPLPQASAGRFPDGWYRFDYALEGELDHLELYRFKDVLEQAVVHHTGWPLWLFLTAHALSPYEQDGLIECWLKPEEEQALDHLNGAGLLWRISGGKITSMETDWATSGLPIGSIRIGQ